mgnify:FL=1
MSISKGSLKRVNDGGAARLPGDVKKSSGIQVSLQQVPIDQLQVTQEVEVDKTLKKSIEKWTMLVPIIVYVDKSQELVVISGAKRLAVAKDLKMDTVFCQVIQGLSLEQVYELGEELEQSKLEQSDLQATSIHEEKFKMVSSIQSSLPSYLL